VKIRVDNRDIRPKRESGNGYGKHHDLHFTSHLT